MYSSTWKVFFFFLFCVKSHVTAQLHNAWAPLLEAADMHEESKHGWLIKIISIFMNHFTPHILQLTNCSRRECHPLFANANDGTAYKRYTPSNLRQKYTLVFCALNPKSNRNSANVFHRTLREQVYQNLGSSRTFLPSGHALRTKGLQFVNFKYVPRSN